MGSVVPEGESRNPRLALAYTFGTEGTATLPDPASELAPTFTARPDNTTRVVATVAKTVYGVQLRSDPRTFMPCPSREQWAAPTLELGHPAFTHFSACDPDSTGRSLGRLGGHAAVSTGSRMTCVHLSLPTPSNWMAAVRAATPIAQSEESPTKVEGSGEGGCPPSGKGVVPITRQAMPPSELASFPQRVGFVHSPLILNEARKRLGSQGLPLGSGLRPRRAPGNLSVPIRGPD